MRRSHNVLEQVPRWKTTAPDDSEAFYRMSIEVRDGDIRCGYYDGQRWNYTEWAELIGGMTFFKTGNYTQEPIQANREPPRSLGRQGQTTVMVRDIVVEHDD